MPVQRLSERIAPWVNEEIERQDQGEDFFWEFCTVPTQHSPAIPGLIMHTPSPILGQFVGCHIGMPNMSVIPEGDVRATIGQAVEFLRQQKSEILAAQVPPTNGQGPAPGPNGLHLP